MEHVIRPGKIEDCSDLIVLLEELGYQQGDHHTLSILQAYLSSSSYHLLVAEVRHKIVGVIALAVHDLFVMPGKRCRIEALIVAHNFRKNGMGKGLLQAAESWAAETGCTVIELTAGVHRAASGAHNFFIHHGYSNDGPQAKLYLRKQL